jgi:hypothetical protein
MQWISRCSTVGLKGHIHGISIKGKMDIVWIFVRSQKNIFKLHWMSFRCPLHHPTVEHLDVHRTSNQRNWISVTYENDICNMSARYLLDMLRISCGHSVGCIGYFKAPIYIFYKYPEDVCCDIQWIRTGYFNTQICTSCGYP